MRKFGLSLSGARRQFFDRAPCKVSRFTSKCIEISMRIILAISVTVATGERTFSKLELIETLYEQRRRKILRTLCIENEILQDLYYFTELIQNFAHKVARKKF